MPKGHLKGEVVFAAMGDLGQGAQIYVRLCTCVSMCVLMLLSSAFPHSAAGDLTRLLPFLFPLMLVHPLLSY